MAAQITYEKDKMTVFLDGDLDHHSAAIIRAGIDDALLIKRPKVLILDFAKITFMDSSGIGLVMGRYKLMQSLGGEIVMQNLPQNIKKVMYLAGLDRLGKIKDSEVTI